MTSVHTPPKRYLKNSLRAICIFCLASVVSGHTLAQLFVFESRVTSSDICNTERTSNVTFIHARWQFGQIRNNSTSNNIPVSCPVSTLFDSDSYNIGYVVYNNGTSAQTVSCSLTEWDFVGAKAQVLSGSVDLPANTVDVLSFDNVSLVDALNLFHVRCVLPPKTSLGLHFVDNFFSGGMMM